jgi:hypothetical protein
MIEYIYDSKGEKKGVIIPIELWEKNKSKILDNSKNKKVFRPSKYRGIYKDMEIDLNKEVRKIRDEWERI